MTLNVWYISKYLTLPSDRVGGRSFYLLREMARLGHRVIAFTSDSNHLVNGPQFDGPQLEQTRDGVSVIWLRTLKYKGAKSLGRILSWVDFERRFMTMDARHFPPPDVVIASSLSLLSILSGIRMQRRFGCKLIFEVRDIWPLTICEDGGFSPRNPFVRILAAIERFGYRRSDAIVGTMPNLSAHVHEVAGPETAPVYTIPMGVSDDQLDEGEPLSVDYLESHIPKGKFIVCHAGTIGITNALETFLACAEQMRDRDDIHFLIVG